MEIFFTFGPPSVTPHPPAGRDHDPALVAEVRSKLAGLADELRGARSRLAAECATALREDHAHGVGGDHVAAIKATVATITRLEGEVLFFETTLIGLEAPATVA